MREGLAQGYAYLQDEVVERLADLSVNTKQNHEHDMGMEQKCDVHGMRSKELRLVHLQARLPSVVDVWQHVLRNAVWPKVPGHLRCHSFGRQLIPLVAVLHPRQSLQVFPIGHLVLLGCSIVSGQRKDVIDGAFALQMRVKLLRRASYELECHATLLASASKMVSNARPHQTLKLEDRVGFEPRLVDGLTLLVQLLSVFLLVNCLLSSYGLLVRSVVFAVSLLLRFVIVLVLVLLARLGHNCSTVFRCLHRSLDLRFGCARFDLGSGYIYSAYVFWP